MMTESKFRDFLANGHALNYIYKENGILGVINTWLYQGKFVLKRQECKEGVRWDEGNLIHDYLFRFPDIDAVVEYLNEIGISPTKFKL